ncbi:MAG: dephospho-CoA kinase [Lachnospiraceae bacterium]
MKIIGITGGVGSGKTEVLRYLQQSFGAKVYQADMIAHDLQKQGQPCYERIVSCFGKQILTNEGNIDRAILGNIVFADSNQRLRLNALVHPLVKEKIQFYIRKEKQLKTQLFVLEAALLIEDDYGTMCDELWYIYAEESIRRMRLEKNRNYNSKKIDAIISAQLPETVFRSKCNRVIDNSQTFQNTCQQIEEVMYEIM